MAATAAYRLPVPVVPHRLAPMRHISSGRQLLAVAPPSLPPLRHGEAVARAAAVLLMTALQTFCSVYPCKSWFSSVFKLPVPAGGEGR